MIVGVCLAAAVLVPNVEFVLGLSGATAASCIMGVLPSCTFLVAAVPAQTLARSDLGISTGQGHHVACTRSYPSALPARHPVTARCCLWLVT